MTEGASDDAISAALADLTGAGAGDETATADPAAALDAGAGAETAAAAATDSDRAPADDGPDDGPGAGGLDLVEWATSVPEGSYRDFDAGEWWDPDAGAENRVAFHLADLAGAGAGYPNVVGVLVGLAELYWARVLGRAGSGSSDDSDSDGDRGAGAGEVVPRKTAEALV